jgi:hypothetical protein
MVSSSVLYINISFRSHKSPNRKVTEIRKLKPRVRKQHAQDVTGSKWLRLESKVYTNSHGDIAWIIHFLLLKQNTGGWVIYTEKRFV